MSTIATTADPELEIAPWDEWNPRDYNNEYYSALTLDGWYLMQWVVESLRHVPPVDRALEFGCGPTVLPTFPFVPKAREIHMAEYLPVNRQAVQEWIDNKPDVHDWRQFTLEFLRLEGNLRPTEEEAAAREAEVRRRMTQVLPGDAENEDPLGPEKRGSYPLVMSLCCAEGATTSAETWHRYMKNIMSLVAPGGTMIQSVCEGCRFYCVGSRKFPGAGVDRNDVLRAYTENGFTDIDFRVRYVPDIPGDAFNSTILVRGVKAK